MIGLNLVKGRPRVLAPGGLRASFADIGASFLKLERESKIRSKFFDIGARFEILERLLES